MSKEYECRKLIRGIIGEPNQDSHLCIVTAVDGATCDVKRIIDGKEIKRVRLNATIKASDGLVIVPKIDSAVLVTKIDSNKYFVSQFSEIEKIILNVTDNIEVNAANTITFNGGENGGLTITPELKTQLDKMTKRIDGIMDAIKNAQPTTDNSGAGLKTAMVTALEMITDIEDFSQIENTKITH